MRRFVASATLKKNVFMRLFGFETISDADALLTARDVAVAQGGIYVDHVREGNNRILVEFTRT